MPPTSNSAQDLTWDFIEFLAKRKERSSAAASLLIGEWLVSYEPGPIALSHGRKTPRLEWRSSNELRLAEPELALLALLDV